MSCYPLTVSWRKNQSLQLHDLHVILHVVTIGENLFCTTISNGIIWRHVVLNVTHAYDSNNLSMLHLIIYFMNRYVFDLLLY